MQRETHQMPSPEQRARQIIPLHYRAETGIDIVVADAAQIRVMPSMEMELSSRCAGALRDAVAGAIRSAEAAARADEREACAKVADDAYNQATTALQKSASAHIPALAVKFCQGRQQEAMDIADAIKARGTAEGEG